MINRKSYEITNYNEGLSIEFKASKQGGTIARTNLSLIKIQICVNLLLKIWQNIKLKNDY